jgi:hypothetical protein
MDPMNPAPETLDVGVGGWCVRDPEHIPAAEAFAGDEGPSAFRWKPKDRPEGFILIEPPQERRLDDASLLAVALIGKTRDWQVKHEVLVYRNGAEAENDELLRYVRERTQEEMIVGPSGKPEPRRRWKKDDVRIPLIPLSEFQKLFRFHAYTLEALVIAFDLPRALSRVATRPDEVKRGRYCKGWSFEMLAPGGKEEGSRHRRNRARIKTASRGATFIGFDGWGKAEGAGDPGNDAGENAGKRTWHRGHFLCLRLLAYALSSDRNPTLESALKMFTGEILGEVPATGLDGAAAIDRILMTTRASLSLASELVHLFDTLPQSRARTRGSFPETKAQSPASLTRALARQIRLGAPAVPPDRLGSAAEAFHGGWVENTFRGFVVVWSVDYSKQHAMIAALVRLQNFLAAGRLDFVDATQEARELAATLTDVDILRREIWPRLAVLCWVRCEGEIVPIKARFDRKQFSMGMIHYHSDGNLLPLRLPDVIAAKLLSGRSPEIVRAERIVPAGGRRPLRKAWLPSGARLDPHTRDVFLTLVEEGERLRRGDGRWSKVPGPTREALYTAWKAGNNGLAFSNLAQTNEADLEGKRREEVSLLFDGGSIRAKFLHPADPGPFACCRWPGS